MVKICTFYTKNEVIAPKNRFFHEKCTFFTRYLVKFSLKCINFLDKNFSFVPKTNKYVHFVTKKQKKMVKICTFYTKNEFIMQKKMLF